MPIYFGAIAMTIVANVVYHLCSKKVPGNINPFLALAATYATALIVCLALLPFTALEGGARVQISRLNSASFILGAAIVLLEFGFILAYRVGWNISLAALYSNVAVGILLLPAGVLFFNEQLTMTQGFGLVFAFTGLFLLSK